MKTIKQLLSELPNKSLIFAFGRFNPPTVGHELLISKVEALSKKTSIPYRIYTTATQDKKSNPLSQKDKIKYMEKSFRNAHIYAAKGNIIQLLQSFEKEGIKEIHLVVGSDRTKEFESLLNKYNGREYKFSKIEIHSAGERDPDSDDADGMSASKMRSAASKGDYKSFEKGVTKKLTDVDTKKMYNDVRKGLGLKTESFEINISNNQNELREKYFKGEIFKIGTTVKDDKGVYEIMDRGTNYITVINENGELSKKWLDSVKEVITDMNYKTETKDEHQISYKGFTTSNFEIVPELKPIIESVISSETDSVAIINALKSIDESLKFYKQNKDVFQVPLIKGIDALKNIDHAVSGMVADLILKLPRGTFKETSITEASDNPFNFTSTDKIKIARIIAGALGIDNPEKMSSPEQLINLGLRKLRTKRITPELSDVVNQMLKTADMLDVKYDKKLLPQAMQEATGDKQERITTLKDRVSALLAKLGKINPADADAKTQMAIIKSDIATARLRLQGLQSKEAVDVLGPLGSIDIQNDPITPATMPSFMKFGEMTEENQYVAVHVKKGKTTVMANSSYEAAKKAKEKFGLNNTTDISVMLVKKDGEDVVHKATEEVENLKEMNKYTVKTVVKDPATMAGGEKSENKELSRVVFAKTPDDAKEKVKKVLKTTGYSVLSQQIIKTETVKEEELKEKDKDDPCWVGYKQVGMKKKDGKEVPNCVPESTKLESVLNLIRRIKEQKKTMLVARPNNLMKAGQERVVRIPISKWADYRKKGFIQAEEKENENS